MIKIEKLEVVGLDHAIRGMRNPKDSWDRSDSVFLDSEGFYYTIQNNGNVSYEKLNTLLDPVSDAIRNTQGLGVNDTALMRSLNTGGPVHAKYRRMIGVYCDITAPLYWWKEFDTYKVGTVANSCSTMHRIHAKELTIDDFSHEHIRYAKDSLDALVTYLNTLRTKYLSIKDEYPVGAKEVWYELIQLLPSSYNQKRTVYLNYEVLTNMYKWRKNHKLDEWRQFCVMMEDELPYSWIFTDKD